MSGIFREGLRKVSLVLKGAPVTKGVQTTAIPNKPPLPSPEQASEIHRFPVINAPNITVRIEDIAGEEELLAHLRAGHKVVLYRGFDPNYLPKPGEIYSRPFGGNIENKSEIMEKSMLEAVIEETRQSEFPDCPSRVGSIFCAPTPAEAGKWGEVFAVELRLKPGETGRNAMPVRWLDRTYFEEINRYEYPGISNEDFKHLAKECFVNYFASHGNSRRPADILTDPEQVEVKVLGKYVPSEQQRIADALEAIFVYDPMGNRPPGDLEGLRERLENHDRNEFSKESFQLLEKRAVIKLIEKLREELPRIVDGAICCHPFRLWIERDGMNMGNLEISSIEECLIPENNPYQEGAVEYKELVAYLQSIKEAINSTGHLIYRSYLFELGFARDILSPLKHFKAWEENYRRACQIAKVDPDEKQVQKSKEEYVLSARKYLEKESSLDGYSLGERRDCLLIIKEYDHLRADDLERMRRVAGQITDNYDRTKFIAFLDGMV